MCGTGSAAIRFHVTLAGNTSIAQCELSHAASRRSMGSESARFPTPSSLHPLHKFHHVPAHLVCRQLDALAVAGQDPLEREAGQLLH